MMLTLQSPAKINLFLRIIGRRSDGYHELASLFQAIDLCDTLHLSLGDCDSLTCTDLSLPTDSSNLVLKAAELFRRKTGLKFGLTAHLDKKIPHQAGLGGGSGNAATTLWGLNQLLGEPVSHADLVTWSGEIGSDITFFLSQGTAYCTGRGEILRAMPALPKQKLWIVKSKEGTSTPAVYFKLNAAALFPRDPAMAVKSFYEQKPHYYNDLENAAFQVLPKLASLKQQLLDVGFQTVLLSGSGSSFFCIGNQTPPVLPDVQSFSASFLNRTVDSWYGCDLK